MISWTHILPSPPYQASYPPLPYNPWHRSKKERGRDIGKIVFKNYHSYICLFIFIWTHAIRSQWSHCWTPFLIGIFCQETLIVIDFLIRLSLTNFRISEVPMCFFEKSSELTKNCIDTFIPARWIRIKSLCPFLEVLYSIW